MKQISKSIFLLVILSFLGCKDQKPNPALASIDFLRGELLLCGGVQFAGWLLDHGFIDQLKLKLNPIRLGDGVRLFGNSKTSLVGKLIEKESFDSGLQFLTYELK